MLRDCWVTIESFWIIHVNLQFVQLSQKFLLPNRATRILNLVARMKFLVAFCAKKMIITPGYYLSKYGISSPGL